MTKLIELNNNNCIIPLVLMFPSRGSERIIDIVLVYEVTY